jgi:hypothetical protein
MRVSLAVRLRRLIHAGTMGSIKEDAGPLRQTGPGAGRQDADARGFTGLTDRGAAERYAGA